jgi:16S rRNA (guanine(527)-N(7))-methyltransferase RsmG
MDKYENNFSYSNQLDDEKKKRLEAYVSFLLEYNQKVNLISRKITRLSLFKLIGETIYLNTLISKKKVIDAGSGNGLLGIPIAILTPEKKVVLVESKRKKIEFLKAIKLKNSLDNIFIFEGDVKAYFKGLKPENAVLVARGFPRLDILTNFVSSGKINEIMIITSKRKIIKMKKGMETVVQKIYNIPHKDNIIVFKMENVSRETNSKKL